MSLDEYYEAYYDLARALLLRNTGRIRDKFLAQKIYEDIVDTNEPIFPDFFLSAIKNLIDLLFNELKISGDTEILKKIRDTILKFKRYQNLSGSVSMEIEIHIFQSKIYFLEMNFDQALEELNHARIISKKYDLIHYDHLIEDERSTLLTEITNILKLSNKEDLTLFELVDLFKTDRLIGDLVRIYTNKETEEISKYISLVVEIVKETP